VSVDTLQNSAVDAGIKMRPTNEELSSMSPEFSDRWSTFFANAPDKPVMLAISFAGCVHLIPINPHFELILMFFLLALVGRL
jgi:alcohol oxidase